MINKYWRIKMETQMHDSKYYADPIDIPFSLKERFNWETTQPLGVGKELVYKFIIPDSNEKDLFFTGTEYEIYSIRLIKLIESMGVKFQTFNAEFFSRSSGENLSIPFKVFRLLEVRDVLDVENSVINPSDIEGFNITKHERLVFKKFHEPNLHLFRLESNPSIGIIGDSLRRRFMEYNIKDFEYYEVSS
jgi:hypothetical protein